MTLGELTNTIDTLRQWGVFDANLQLSVKSDAKWYAELRERIETAKTRKNWEARRKAGEFNEHE